MLFDFIFNAADERLELQRAKEKKERKPKMLNFKMTNSNVERCDSIHLQLAEYKTPVTSLRIKL